MIFLPLLVPLDGEGPNEPQATRFIGKDPHHASAPFDLKFLSENNCNAHKEIAIRPASPWRVEMSIPYDYG